MQEERRDTARWAQVGATLFLGVVGLVFTGAQFKMQQDSQEAQFELQEENRRAQSALQLMSQGELSEIDFRQKMFNVLIAQLLDSNVDVRERLAGLLP